MFTGIIEEVGTFKYFKKGEIKVSCKDILAGTNIGDSISVNGVCLTVEKISDDGLHFHVSTTTNNISGFNDKCTGQEINLERALTLEKRIGGHLVSGHIDGTVKIITIKDFYEDKYVELLFRKEFKEFIVSKGSITLDGISLTINEVFSSSFTVTIIKQTFKSTNLKSKKMGDLMNIEVDLLARYLKNFTISNRNQNLLF